MINVADVHDETGLLAALQAGNQAAFKALYEKYHHALYRKTFQLLHSASETEDIIQEAFITLWEKRHDIDTARPLGPWLFTVTFNRAVNHLKKQLREKSKAAGLQPMPDHDFLEVEKQWELLEAAVSQLSPQKRRVFQLCKMEGRTYEEASQLMGISRYTVKEYLGEVMHNLREYVRKHVSYDTTLLVLLLLSCL
ncbi:RNA polymerase sigma-70 factor, ECF subfamily [Chitinophaga jiangningensis]|uniref:RNA polymerase sigma-70 factor, ECF subfamily n=1 Tax=Chitinophaga jiangningensis TaxID=1419482 RepID=A0A1M7CIW3_9BACT|nr:RNA polymerase sigma factor [Chitinophaga jiangningensis]SHL67097.1 RNA polymerase sigma-70 factor, ECF subfamily [Chitinophaga jiangningensis]